MFFLVEVIAENPALHKFMDGKGDRDFGAVVESAVFCLNYKK